MNPKEILSILKKTASDWMEDQAPTLGAALAYYTVFSLAPLLIIAIAIAGLVLGQEAAQGQIFEQLRGLLGEESGKAMQTMVQNASAKPATGVVATLIGVVTLLFGASGVFGQLQSSLNTIWEVQPKPGRGILGILRDRILSFGFILVVGFLLLVSLLLTAGIALVAKWFGGMFPGMETLAHLVNFVLSLALITVLFAMIFKFLPDARIAWHVPGPLSWKKRRWLVVWRRRLAHRVALVGLLFRADPFLRSGVHSGLCESVRLSRRSCGECDCCAEACKGMSLPPSPLTLFSEGK
jgi:membrane protein